MKRNIWAKKQKKTKKRLDKSRKKSYNGDSGYSNHKKQEEDFGDSGYSNRLNERSECNETDWKKPKTFDRNGLTDDTRVS